MPAMSSSIAAAHFGHEHIINVSPFRKGMLTGAGSSRIILFYRQAGREGASTQACWLKSGRQPDKSAVPSADDVIRAGRVRIRRERDGIRRKIVRTLAVQIVVRVQDGVKGPLILYPEVFAE